MSNQSRNVLTIEVGGESLTLRYNMGALEYLGRITRKDPLDGLSAMESEFANLRNIIEAGIVGEALHNDQEPKIENDRAKKIAAKLSVQESRSLSKFFAASYIDDAVAPAEGSGDTQL